MDSYIAEVLPHQKLEKIKGLQSDGEFVGHDRGRGQRCAPALAQADVGIAVSAQEAILPAETAGSS